VAKDGGEERLVGAISDEHLDRLGRRPAHLPERVDGAAGAEEPGVEGGDGGDEPRVALETGSGVEGGELTKPRVYWCSDTPADSSVTTSRSDSRT
jgi:hypothetical protein